MEDSINENPSSSLLGESDSAAKELDKLRSAVMDRDGLIAGVFELLRRVPRYGLLPQTFADAKAPPHDLEAFGPAAVPGLQPLHDTQRAPHLHHHRAVLHASRLVHDAPHPLTSVWDADRTRIGREYGQMGLSLPLIREIVGAWWSYASNTVFFGVLGWGMDVDARWRKMTLWLHGLTHGGLNTASLEVAGLKA